MVHLVEKELFLAYFPAVPFIIPGLFYLHEDSTMGLHGIYDIGDRIVT